MKLTQYGDYFYLYLLLLTFIPAIVLALKGINIKYYGLIVSIAMIYLIMGKTIGLIMFLMFLAGEITLIYGYLYLRKKNDSRYLYWAFLFMSIIPVIITKVAGLTRFAPYIGFIGLSYLNFKAIQIIIEIYDGRITEIKFIDFINFILFFPTLSSGPIDRWKRFEENLNSKIEKNEYVNEFLLVGLRKIFIAIIYKFIIAYLIDTYWLLNIPKEVNIINSINYMYAYTMYLFFDFAGYSLFAIGTSYIFGIKTPENFNKPFLSKDMKEFWTRWHISLSRWFGDYIFSRFVLDSMRKKRFRSRFTASHVAQIITMFIMGLWHGLTVYYILYGLYQGVALVLTDIYQRKSTFYKKNKNQKWFNCVQIAITFHIVCFGMLIFSGYLFK
ncbi:membrane protein involved in D-alanine export [Clostridium saccharoperbutylacetonicum]|uniref:Teichoic acid D-alanyltransferase n=1 Tax=Clostridium saccharoperbutylacetonicum N1-4(HMT) TaxID=931276 RepID=M1MKB3_9CLOT|nr:MULTISPECIES: D-alanyl-lipoteichoic acid biosynthesis protein DltB [Clostridium]AGF58364.1 D-alanyl-lipoteichoic acid biosynthesis protein DltB [Clostridium saccharoperbutylacetonicum N1-4(HMT)]NRT60858.1 membrane protein involved in D-alanine export [Clostridium saccharoperbutylacetonicum]NSB24172.1 membrane protein involved in D-alanine export [Clostridium saccharoperbutylacetonicum]NSB43550.1 membrane protein involved in D-alanine export [Clostridium saccharoperbutylacetonicum]